MTRNVRMFNPTHRYNGESGPTGKPTVQWSYEFDSDIGAIAVCDGQVHVTGEDGSISVFDTDGNPQWRFQTDGEVRSSPAVVDDTVYVGSYDGHVYALEASGGTKQWSFQTDGNVYSSPAVVDGTVYVGSRGEFDSTVSVGSEEFATLNLGNVHAIDASSGTERWSFQVHTGVYSPAVVDGTVYVGSRDGHVYALDAVSGTGRWSFQTNGAVNSSPAVVDGTVYVGVGGGLRGDRLRAGCDQWDRTLVLPD